MAQYKAGTISIVNGSNLVIGVGTEFLIYSKPGDMFKIPGAPVHYMVGDVLTDTSLVLTANFSQSDAVNSPYAITRDFTQLLGLPEVYTGDADVLALLTEALRLIDTTVGTGLPSPAARAAAGHRVWVSGYAVNGLPDATTQAEIDVRLAAGWPIDSIMWDYLGEAESGPSEFASAGSLSVAPAIGAAELVGVAASADMSIQPSIGAAGLVGVVASAGMFIQPSIGAVGLVGVLAASGMSIQPSIGAAELVPAGSVAASSMALQPTIGAAELIGVVAAQNIAVQPAIGAADLVGVAVAGALSATPAIGAAELVGVLAASGMSIQPTIGAAELLTAGSVAASSMALQPTIGAAELVGDVAAQNIAVQPAIGAADLVGVAVAGALSATPAVGAAELVGVAAAGSLSATPTIGAASAVGAAVAANMSMTPAIGAANLVLAAIAPAQVTGLSVSNTPAQITAIWSDLAGEDGYELYYSIDPGLDAANFDGGTGGYPLQGDDTCGYYLDIPAGTTQMIINGPLTEGVTYYVKVRAVNSAGAGPLSAAAAAAAAVVVPPGYFSETLEGWTPVGSEMTPYLINSQNHSGAAGTYGGLYGYANSVWTGELDGEDEEIWDGTFGVSKDINLVTGQTLHIWYLASSGQFLDFSGTIATANAANFAADSTWREATYLYAGPGGLETVVIQLHAGDLVDGTVTAVLDDFSITGP
ncbi:MAG: hypothetical protein A2075_12455 [Geobacteraceae bacterium GWC2_58_44]|nr:MAG: hypothetical protein A2075_12455 [Geobacteraceae bacterium GWC2_58_44]HBG06903.1 hypothetical protein [Geobacter sp.]